MAKGKTTAFFCKECGYESVKWLGQCPGCREWNTFVEEPVVKAKSKGITGTILSGGRAKPSPVSEISIDEEDRILTDIGELDRVLGGGLVKGSLILVGGDPGIGKSTLLLQACRHLAATGRRVLYISGEESLKQIKLRANRLGEFSDNLLLLCETNLQRMEEAIKETLPEVVIVDSIQTIYNEDVESAPGSVSQVRESTNKLMQLAKGLTISVFIVGHVTKEGVVAGPRVLEHMVDTVLYFEGDRSQEYSILRAVKNRFGSTNEIGVFEMTGTGLKEVENPSQLFLQGKPTDISGIATACVVEGTRPLVAEIQTLVSPTPFPAPRRVSVGYDYNRLNLIIAVLEKRCKLFFGNSDTYLNIIGGIRLDDPAADLAVAIALASGLKDFIIPEDTMIIGELGLAGEIRAVTSLERRVTEAKNLGFKRCLIPARNKIDFETSLELVRVDSVRDALNKL